MDGNSLTTIKRIVLKSLHRSRSPISDYKLVFSLACSALMDLNLFTVKSERTVKLKPDSVNCIALPKDFLSLVKIGCNIGGRFWSFTMDNNMIIPQTIVNGVQVLGEGEGFSMIEGMFNPDGTNAGFSFNIYSTTGGKNNYYFKLDYENRRIVLDSIDRSDVILVYKSNGINSSGETLVPVIYEEAIMAFIRWKKAEGERNMSWSQSGKQEYTEECHRLQFLESPSLDDMFDIIYGTYKQTPKR